MFLLESAALPAENYFRVPWPNPLSLSSVGAHEWVAEIAGIAMSLVWHSGY